MTSAPLWIALAAALVSRDGCGSAPPKPSTGSAAAVATGSSSGAPAPSLAPAAAPPAGSAAPTTTSMTPDAQAKLDKLVGARPGSHKPIKPTPESSGSGSGSGSGSSAPKPARNRNAYPQYGRAMSESEMMDIPDMDRHQESFSYGAVVREGYSSVPHYIAFRCIQKPNCGDWAHMGSDWKAVGWWGAVM